MKKQNVYAAIIGGGASGMMCAIRTAERHKDQKIVILEKADRVGKKLSQLSADRQVLCVTHQAQIAAFADNHLFISKSVRDERTYTQVDPLDDEGRVRELARIVGGEGITDSALNHAKQLLKAARN